jgi:glycosyltransferase involved in cell wall biosynthesis
MSRRNCSTSLDGTQSSINPMHSLTIAVPTFNRASKLDRLLGLFRKEIESWNAPNRIQLIVCDNASTDSTRTVVTAHASTCSNIRYYRNEENLGFDGNVKRCFDLCSTDYIWFFSDDDIPDPDSVKRITGALDKYTPDVLLFSFRQPATQRNGAFNFKDSVYVESDLRKCVELLFGFPKVSTFVIRKLNFNLEQENFFESTIGDGFSFIVLALTVLDCRPLPQLAVISEPLASSDNDFDKFDWTPEPFLRLSKQARHPFFERHAPDLKRVLEKSGYLTAISLSFDAKSGKARVSDLKRYDEFIASLSFDGPALLANPRQLIKYILLKLKIVPRFPSNKKS